MRRGNGSADAAELFAQSKYSHDPHCFVRVDLYNIPVEVCQCCKSIASARADERERCIDIATLAAGKSPTLGQQRMLRALRGDS